MKKIWMAVALLAIMPTAQANEIPGTRVAGQGAVCGEGEGKALEINVTTKQEWSYCFKREVIAEPIRVAPTPTPTPTPTPAPTNTETTSPQPTATTESTSGSQTNTEPTSSDSATVTVTPTPTPTPTPKPTPTLPPAPELIERSNVVEVNATTNVTTVREETIEEWLGRILWGWTNWYEELMRWFASMWE